MIWEVFPFVIDIEIIWYPQRVGDHYQNFITKKKATDFNSLNQTCLPSYLNLLRNQPENIPYENEAGNGRECILTLIEAKINSLRP